MYVTSTVYVYTVQCNLDLSLCDTYVYEYCSLAGVYETCFQEC